MKKLFFCVTLALSGLMTACVDKNEAVDAESKPEWLGESIYQELKNPTHLTGTFSTYLRLIDDLGLAEMLNRTGSKTLFPANDEAFSRFFQSNSWGVTSYEQLSTAQKKMLLYNSMLDNAILVGMLSNVSNTNRDEGVDNGEAVKHETSISVTDTIQQLTSGLQMPQNNIYWDKYRNRSQMYLVSDASRSMMVHFTPDYMIKKKMKLTGDDSDFQVLTGNAYQDGMAYVFGKQIVKKDVTCQNGYIHQMQDVIIPPGNMAQMLRDDSETSLFSRVIDYFSAPYYNKEVTDNYNAVALQNGTQIIDSIFEVRYLNDKSGHSQKTDPDGNSVGNVLPYDPGWNQYSSSSTVGDITDIGSMLVPTDAAVKKFFTAGGDGAYLIDLYGKYKGSENTEAHIEENLDSLYKHKPEILTKFARNLMLNSFKDYVPSRFGEIQTSDSHEYMGVSLDMVNKRSDGSYDVKIANNGVIYKMNVLLAPDEYQSVMAPASVFPEMSVMNWAVQDDDKLGVSFHYYLMAMKSKFAFFIPDNDAFMKYYVDPVYLGHDQPRALRFYLAGDTTVLANGTKRVLNVRVRARAYQYNPETNEVGEVLRNGAEVDINEWKTLFVDILNYHTVVLEKGEEIGTNNYYKTKHGGEIRISGTNVGSAVASGQQIDNGLEPSVITRVDEEKNGTAFGISSVIQSPRNSVSKTLQLYDRFSEFYNMCSGFGDVTLLNWAGISDVPEKAGFPSPQDNYIIFTTDYKYANSTNTASGNCLDENVKMFNTYNYTLYAPNNEAMQKAYAAGLPSWSKVQALYDAYSEAEGPEAEQAIEQAKAMIDMMRDFTRYHFQSVSVYADNVIPGGRYNSLSTDELGLAVEMSVSGGNGVLNVTDASGHTVRVDANNSARLSNLMARDFWFDSSRRSASSIYTSSFCVVHEIAEPLNCGSLGLTWNSRSTRKSAKRK